MLKGLTLLKDWCLEGYLPLLFSNQFCDGGGEGTGRDYKRLVGCGLNSKRAKFISTIKTVIRFRVSGGAGWEGAKCLDGTGFGGLPVKRASIFKPYPGQTAIGLGGAYRSVYVSDGENYVITLGIEHKIPEVGVEKACAVVKTSLRNSGKCLKNTP